MIEVNTVIGMSKDEKIKQIEIRQELLLKLVGSIYPSIVRDEISKIQKSM